MYMLNISNNDSYIVPAKNNVDFILWIWLY